MIVICKLFEEKYVHLIILIFDPIVSLTFLLSLSSLYKLWLLSVSFTPLLFSSLFQPQRQLPKSISFNIHQLIHFSDLLLSQLFCSFLIEISLLDFLPQFFYLLILVYYFVCLHSSAMLLQLSALQLTC